MQQAPAFLALSIRSAFRTSRASSRVLRLPAKCAAQRPAPPWQPWPKHDPCLIPRHFSTSRVLADEKAAGDTSQNTKSPTAETSPSRSPEPDLPSKSSNSPVNPDALPSHTESRRSLLAKRFSHIMDTAQSNIFVASQHLNDLTGYSGIEALKREIDNQEKRVQETRTAVKTARDAYNSAISIRSSSQREVNDLLQRKHTWSPADLERFTSLYRSDHVNEQAEARAQEDLSRVEREAEETATRLATTILARYHEEQIWSDKIRRMSTWGTWGLMGLNVFLFLIFQVAIEPWRRRRLVRGFEEKVMEALEKEKPVADIASSPGNETNAAAQMILIAEPSDPRPISTPSPSEPILATAEGIQEEITPLQDPTSDSPSASSTPPSAKVSDTVKPNWHTLKETLHEMFSEKKNLTITQKEMTTAVIEGAAGGAALMGLLMVLLRPR